jgi:hypothetical protein
VILPPFWAARLTAWFSFAESKFRVKAADSQQRRFDLLLEAMTEKILDQIMDMVENVSEDLPYDMLKVSLLETNILSAQEKMDILFNS